MSTPTPPEILSGDIWVLTNDLGVGLGAIPAGAEVTIETYLPPGYPGTPPTPEYTVVSSYRYQDWGYDQNGKWAMIDQSRLLAYPESDFRAMFQHADGGA